MNFSVAAIIKYKDKYLFQKRDNKKGIFYPGFYGLFGGLPKKKEKPVDCIKRELKEELSLNFQNIRFFLTTDLKSVKFKKKKSKIFKRHFFLCELPVNFQKKINLKEGSGYKFINLKNINILKFVPFDLAAVFFHLLINSKKKIVPKKYIK